VSELEDCLVASWVWLVQLQRRSDSETLVADEVICTAGGSCQTAVAADVQCRRSRRWRGCRL